MSDLLEVRDLQIRFATPESAPMVAVDDVTFVVGRGELVALVGESGCGKTLTGLAIPHLLPPGATLGTASRIHFDGVDLVGLPERALQPFRGARIAMVFQDPMASLNPVLRVGAQIAEALQAHNRVSDANARARATALLAEVGIADPAARIDAWPHQLSGGMRQRVMLAIALASEPDLLIADEPTTALDVTVQAQILELLDTLRRTRRMAVLLITHDLGIVAGRADRVLVMYAGRIVESAPAAALFAAPRHPYTRGLLHAIPRLDGTAERLTPIAGVVPPPHHWPDGCRFHPRCPLVVASCGVDRPPLIADATTHATACWVTAGPQA